MLKIVALLAFMPGLTWAHEVPGWEIENTRSDILKTTILTKAIAGDWCGIEPATLALVCDDDELSLTIKSNCAPYTTPDSETTIGFALSGPGIPLTNSKVFDVLEDGKTLVLSRPFRPQGIFLNGIIISSYGISWEPTIIFSLPELDRPSRDIIFDVRQITKAVKAAGMQCSTQSLFN